MSNILLFEPNATDFTGQGQGVLSATIKCEITEELNGQYELVMEYPLNGIHCEEIRLRSLIVCQPGFSGSRQAFRVYQIDKNLKGSITVYASHLSYDLSGYPVKPFASYGGSQQAVKALLDESKVEDCPFSISTELNEEGTFAVDVPSSIRSWMNGKEGSLTEVFGGEWQYDNFDCYLVAHRGADRGVTIRYGKNLTRLDRSDDDQEHYTAVWAYYSYVHQASSETNSTPIYIANTAENKIKIDNYYAASTSGTTAPADNEFLTGDAGKAVTITKDNPYLWTYKVISYLNDNDTVINTTRTAKQKIGEYGEVHAYDVLWDDFGQSLVPGEHTRKSSVKEYYFQSDSNTDAPVIGKDKWSGSASSKNTKKPYVWSYTCVTIDGKKEHITTSDVIPTGAYTYEKILCLDASNEDFHLGENVETPTTAQLNEYVRDYIAKEEISAEVINVEFDFAQLEDVKERIELGDTIRVYNDYEEVTARCVKTVWDVLKERYTSIEVGDARVTYESSLRNRTNTQIQGALEDVYKKLIDSTLLEVSLNYVNTSNIETYATEYGFTKAQTVSDNYSDINLSNVDTDNIATPFYEQMDIHYLNSDVINAHYISVDTLDAQVINSENINAHYANIETLETNYLTADTISSTYLQTANLDTEVANVGYLKATDAAITYLTADNADLNYAKINLLNVNNSWIENGVIKNGAISNAMVGDLSANKLTSGDLDCTHLRVLNLSASSITTGRLVVDGLVIDVEQSEAQFDGNYIQNGTITLAGMSQEVLDRMDGAVETWTGNTVPTNFNYPASDWTTSAQKQAHVGDVYYCGAQTDMAVAGIAVAGVAIAGNENIEGRSYRWIYDNTEQEYYWLLLKDSDITKALAEIEAIKEFDVQVGHFMTETDEGVEDLYIKYTSLEGTAETLSGEMQLKLNKSVFNTVAHTADENIAEIKSYTDLTQVWTNPDGTTTTITGITNIVNKLKQTEDSFSVEISSLEDTVQSSQRNFLRMIDGDINEAETSKCTFTYDKGQGKYVLTRIASSSSAYTQIRPVENWRVPDTLRGENCIFHVAEIASSRAAANPRLYLVVFNVAGESGAVAGTAKAGKATVSGTQVRSVYLDKNTKAVQLTMPDNDCTMRLTIRMDQSKNDITGETLTVRGVKLEKGELTTDWTPAVEDTTEFIESKYSRLYQDLDGFKLEVGDTYQTITGMGAYSTTVQMNSAIQQSANQINLSVNSAVSDLNGQISSAQSEIDQLADKIVLKVNSNGKIAKMALDANPDSTTGTVVTISADNIDLNGAVTMSALDSTVKTTINNAANNASSAVTNANNAVDTANNAQTTANNAVNYSQKHYGTCSTAAGTVAKAVTLSGFSLYTGAQVTVYFTYANTASNPTLNVNSTGAKPIWVKNAAITAPYYWTAKDTVTFTYNGTNWVMADSNAASTVAAWCYENNKTYINGSTIATGTIYADQIHSGAITTDKIDASAVTAEKIATNAITTDKLNASAVTAVKIAANAITADKIAANAVTAAKISVTDLYTIGATIGGWNINSSTIYSEGSNYRCALFKYSNAPSNIAMCVYNTSTDERFFTMRYDGSVTASKMTITGGEIQLTNTDETYSLFRAICESNAQGYRVVSAVRPYQFQQLSYDNYIRVEIGAGRMECKDVAVSTSIPKASFGLANPNKSGSSFGTFALQNASGTTKISGNASTGSLICVSLTQTSDLKWKTDIAPLNSEKSAEFIYGLQPMQFRFLDTNNDIHHGFIAQDVEVISGDWDLVHNTDAGKTLNYIEIIADLVATVQSLNERISKLERSA